MRWSRWKPGNKDDTYQGSVISHLLLSLSHALSRDLLSCVTACPRVWNSEHFCPAFGDFRTGCLYLVRLRKILTFLCVINNWDLIIHLMIWEALPQFLLRMRQGARVLTTSLLVYTVSKISTLPARKQ